MVVVLVSAGLGTWGCWFSSKQCLQLGRGSWTEPRNFSARALEEGCRVCSGGWVSGVVCVGGGRGGCVVVGDPFVPYVAEVAYRAGQVVVLLGQLKLGVVCQVVGECAHGFGGIGEFLGGCVTGPSGAPRRCRHQYFPAPSATHTRSSPATSSPPRLRASASASRDRVARQRACVRKTVVHLQ